MVKCNKTVLAKSIYWYKGIALKKPVKLIKAVMQIRKKNYGTYPHVRPGIPSNEEVLLYLYSAAQYQKRPGSYITLNKTSLELYQWLTKRFIAMQGMDCPVAINSDTLNSLKSFLCE